MYAVELLKYTTRFDNPIDVLRTQTSGSRSE
jgi:hypothetical protein